MIDDFKPHEAKPFDKDHAKCAISDMDEPQVRTWALDRAERAHLSNELCLQRGEYIRHLEKLNSRLKASLESQKRLNERLNELLISALAEINTNASDV